MYYIIKKSETLYFYLINIKIVLFYYYILNYIIKENPINFFLKKYVLNFTISEIFKFSFSKCDLAKKRKSESEKRKNNPPI